MLTSTGKECELAAGRSLRAAGAVRRAAGKSGGRGRGANFLSAGQVRGAPSVRVVTGALPAEHRPNTLIVLRGCWLRR